MRDLGPVFRLTPERVGQDDQVLGTGLLLGPGEGWHDPSGAQQQPTSQSAFSLPFAPIPDQNQGGKWADLNGDGLPDIVYSSDGGIYASSPNCPGGLCTPVTTAWINTFHPPIINQFPNALAGPTTVAYAVITTADAQKPGGAYDDSVPLAPNTIYMTAPLRVVTSTTADAGLGRMVPEHRS